MVYIRGTFVPFLPQHSLLIITFTTFVAIVETIDCLSILLHTTQQGEHNDLTPRCHTSLVLHHLIAHSLSSSTFPSHSISETAKMSAPASSAADPSTLPPLPKDHLSHPENWATGGEPATEAQKGFIKVLEDKNPSLVPEFGIEIEGLGKSEASEVIESLKLGKKVFEDGESEGSGGKEKEGEAKEGEETEGARKKGEEKEGSKSKSEGKSDLI